MSEAQDDGTSAPKGDAELTGEIKKLNDDIHEQNERFDKTQKRQFKYPEIQKETQAGITDEQIDSFIDLLSKTKDIDYTDIAVQSLQAREELTKREQEVDEGLENDVEFGVDIVPQRAAKITGLGEAIREKQLKGLRDAAEASEEKVEAFGQAWEIPRAITPEDRMILFDMVNEKDTEEGNILIDIIPLTPAERESQVSFVEGLKRQIKAPNATQIIVEYLKANAKKVISREEIARLLYVADLEQKDIDHVTSRLGPKTKQAIINAELEGTGLKLQYGYRYEVDEQTEKILRRTRIYRAIEPGEDLPKEYVTRGSVKGTSVRDEFKSLTTETGAVEVIPPEDSQVVDEVVETELEKVEREAREWAESIERDAEEVVERLIRDKLFSEDEMRASAIRSLTSSKHLGSTEVDKLVQVGLMKGGQKKLGVMTREQRVIAMMFKKHPELERKKNGHQLALEIIRAVIAAKLEANEN